MNRLLYKCFYCGDFFDENDIDDMTHGRGRNRIRCMFCAGDHRYKELAHANIYGDTKFLRVEHPPWLVECISIFLKTQQLLQDRIPCWCKIKIPKKEHMITTVTNSFDMRQALNENLHGLLTGKRKPLVVKEVNNTLGKMLSDVKMEMMQNAMLGERTRISWFDRNVDTTKVLSNGHKKELAR